MKQLLIKYIKKNLAAIIVLSSLSVTTVACNIIYVYLTGIFVDNLIKITSYNRIYRFVVDLVGISVVIVIANVVIQIVTVKINANIVFWVNDEVVQHIKKLPLAYFHDEDMIYLNQKVNGDINTLVDYTIDVLTQTPIILGQIIVVGFLLTSNNLTLGVIGVCSIIVYIIVYFVYQHKLNASTYAFKECQNKMISKIYQQFSNIKYVKRNSLFKKFEDELVGYFPMFLRVLTKYIKVTSVYSGMTSIMEKIFNIVVFLIGGISVVKGKLNIGEFIICQSYYTMMLAATSSIAEQLKGFPGVKVCFDRLEDIINIKEEHNGYGVIQSNIKEIKLKNVSFGFQEKSLVNRFSYDFRTGNIYVLKGTNGVGKTSLLDLIIGIYPEKYSGEIFYNDIDIHDINMYLLRQTHLMYLDQSCSYVMKNAYEEFNIKEKIDNQLVKNYLKEFDLDEEFDYKNFELLSGGERQKLLLSNILASKKELIILDEPTSALDDKSKRKLFEILQKNKSNKIYIIVTHDNIFDDCADDIIKF